MRLPLAIARALFSLAVTFTVLLTAHSATARAIAKVQLAEVPTNLRLGDVAVGQAKTGLVTVTNPGGASLTVSQTRHPAYRIYIASSTPYEVPIIPLTDSGDDAAELAVTPATMNFGNVSPGSSALQSGTLSATNSAVTIFSVTSSDSEFIVSGLSLPMTIPAGQNVPFTVTFVPQSSSTVSATLSFASDASNSPAIEYVSASSVPPHSVDLSWNASTSQNVIGYNVYRSEVSGGPYNKFNPTLDPDLTYTDNFVSSGNTYYYVATAVDSNNQESTYSNEVQAIIP